ncbi:unnamed protein product [Mytilus edulis]|uniref:Uncharacterized protein n=1 Tax=Mytilus edulis TaxID=6550 RepID=A0A8S3R0L6_MYTED|nr:unnamed protein product [Mytilus edulis]
MVEKVDLYNGKLENFRSDVDSLSKDVNKMKSFEDYTGPKVRELDIRVRNLQSQNTGLFQPINVCVALAFILIAALFYMTYYRYDNGGTQFREHERTESHSTPPFMSQRAPSILDRIQRVPVFDNKVCVLSFYSETMNLHKQLVKSALATNKRGGNIEVIQHLVRRHEDILNIPGARYIFVFVDFNERNVILENPGQDLGDKKLVTVQAAQKLGADVFVTYVRDRGSNQLVPGNLYNQELSAFTSHHVLRGLKATRDVSVYMKHLTTHKKNLLSVQYHKTIIMSFRDWKTTRDVSVYMSSTGFIIAMPTIQAQLQAQIQAQTQDIKKLQDDIRRLKEDFGRNKEFDRKDDDDIKEDVDIKEKKQPLLLFAIIIGVVIVPFIAFSINNTMRLNEYDRKLKDLEKFQKNIDGLNEITSDIPILESRVTDVKKQIRGIEIFMPNATQDIAYLKRELENMNSTENKVKDIESSVSSINDSYVELKKLSDLQKEQLKQFNTSINTTNTQIISLSKNADVANSTLAPIIQNQTELLKNITDSNVRMLEINDTVNSITLRLLDVSRNITDLQPQLEIVGKAAAQMTEMQKDVDKLQTETRNVKSSMSTMKLETKEAELKVSNMSTKVDEYSSVVTGHEEKLKTLQEEQSEVDNKIKMSNKKQKN